MSFSGSLIAPRIDLRKYKAALNARLMKLLSQAASRWLNATAIAIVPVWSGASRGTFLKLASSVSFQLSIGRAPNAPGRVSQGRTKSEGGISVDKQKAKHFFFYRSTLEHLVHNEFNPPPAGFNLTNPGPYRFQEAGAAAFTTFAATATIPSPWGFLNVKRFKL